MSATSPTAPPSKRSGFLRTLVTVVEPVDRETHAQRWNRPMIGPRSPTHHDGRTGANEAGGEGRKVASLVQGWEEASLGAKPRPYSAIPPGPTSPVKRSFGPSVDLPNRPSPLRSSSQNLSPSSPTDSRDRFPTVPASFFQGQPAKRGVVEPGHRRFSPHPRSPVDKENQPSQPSSPTTSCLLSLGAGLDSSTASFSSSPCTLSSGTDVSQLTDAFTDLTMATRSSESTHTSSLVTNSAENAYVGVASVVTLQRGQQSRAPPATEIDLQATPTRNRVFEAPRIIRTAPTPARHPPHSSREPSSPGLPYLSSPTRGHPPRPEGPVPFDRPLLAQRPTSSFIEALPDSYGRTNSDSTEAQYRPLPLESQPLTPQMPPTGRARMRPRSSSLGAGLKHSFEQHQVETADQKRMRIEREFEDLLDTMQLPDETVRRKMLGLALPLKEEMLRAASSKSASSLIAPNRPTHQRGRSLNVKDVYPPAVTRLDGSKGKKEGGSSFKSFLRKTKSNGSLRAENTKASSPLSRPGSSAGRSRSHSRTGSATSILLRSLGKSSGAATAVQVSSSLDAEDATFWAVKLRTTRCAALEAKELGRLRGRLRNEAPLWIDKFVKNGGYLGLLERLKELLEMEWREEQHDDQVLYEVLRCFKAMTMTAVGKRALASQSPTPFLPVAALLFSEKRPGDLPCRQILVELVHSLFEMCPVTSDALSKSAWSDTQVSLEPAPPSSVPPPSPNFGSGSEETGGGGVRRYTRRAKLGDDSMDSLEREEVLTPERIQQAHRFVMSLMEGPPNEAEEAKVEFIQAAHKPRIFKAWVKEIADCVRDYFWVFCHSNNLFWTLEQIDADAIEAPKVPSGMTGGVEYEAMAYCTAHFRLINALARTCPTVEAAFAFHEQLFMSGFERVLFTLRRASLVYYQSLHLEMSRYISLARSARFNLGPRILACLDRRFLRPEEQMVLREAERKSVQYQSRSGAPQIGAIF
ncbi:GTPase binding protein Rid1 [Rhodotorula toruloides]|uniref:GTPase binding protein Rid1 n=1 Tax=Rhodotorula toruloides TaxID=5286 RepID=A0A511KEP6_RHOTO|nr:GTPase binding protein Rid1 [Rhodotorula toruloides]